MAFLAVVTRVPSPRAPARATGDLQSVYVAPSTRNHGLGARLIEAVLERAWALRLERVTVHSGSRAATFYQRAGFSMNERLMEIAAPARG